MIRVICPNGIDDALRRSALFRRLKPDDWQRLAAVAGLFTTYAKGAMLFQEGDASDLLYAVVTGRVKVFKIDAARHRYNP